MVGGEVCLEGVRMKGQVPSADFGARLPGSLFHLCSLQVVRLQAMYLTSLRLSFFICKMEMIITDSCLIGFLQRLKELIA